MVYDFNNPIFELQKFHRNQCETSGIRPVRQLIDVVGFPCQLADGVRILPVQPGMTSAETTACRTYSLIRNPASPARFLMA